MPRARDARRFKPVRPRKRRPLFATVLLCLPLVAAEFFLATTSLNLESIKLEVVVGKGA